MAKDIIITSKMNDGSTKIIEAEALAGVVLEGSDEDGANTIQIITGALSEKDAVIMYAKLDGVMTLLANAYPTLTTIHRLRSRGIPVTSLIDQISEEIKP